MCAKICALCAGAALRALGSRSHAKRGSQQRMNVHLRPLCSRSLLCGAHDRAPIRQRADVRTDHRTSSGSTRPAVSHLLSYSRLKRNRTRCCRRCRAMVNAASSGRFYTERAVLPPILMLRSISVRCRRCLVALRLAIRMIQFQIIFICTIIIRYYIARQVFCFLIRLLSPHSRLAESIPLFEKFSHSDPPTTTSLQRSQANI